MYDNKAFEKMFNLGGNASAPLQNLGKANTEMCQDLTERTFAILSANTALLGEQIKRLGDVKKPEELLDWTRKCQSENIEAYMDTVEKMTALSKKSFEKMTGSLKDAGKEVSETVMNAGKEKHDFDHRDKHFNKHHK